MAAIYLIMLILSQQPTQQLVGRVNDETGQPIAGVQISSETGRRLNTAETNVDGRFMLPVFSSLQDYPGIARFRLASYRPSTQILKGLPAELVITLQKASEPPWAITKCSMKPQFGGELYMAFLLPKKVKVRKGTDSDFTMQGIDFRMHQMLYAEGPSWSDGLPVASVFNELANVSERDVIFADGTVGAEYRGVRPDGTYYRFIGKAGQTVEYDNATKEAASYFDAILDTLCSSPSRSR